MTQAWTAIVEDLVNSNTLEGKYLKERSFSISKARDFFDGELERLRKREAESAKASGVSEAPLSELDELLLSLQESVRDHNEHIDFKKRAAGDKIADDAAKAAVARANATKTLGKKKEKETIDDAAGLFFIWIYFLFTVFICVCVGHIFYKATIV